MSDILEHNGACSNRSVVILLVFLSSQLIVKKNTVMIGVMCWMITELYHKKLCH